MISVVNRETILDLIKIPYRGEINPIQYTTEWKYNDVTGISAMSLLILLGKFHIHKTKIIIL